jgi:Domain of unknown function (DUF5122) beta-propeller
VTTVRRMSGVVAGGLAALAVAVAVPSIVAADQGQPQSSVVSSNPSDVTPFVKNGRADVLAQIGDRIYVGGSFTQVKNWQGTAVTQTRNYLFAYSATTGQIDGGFNPVINAPVMALGASPDGQLLVGGQFSSVNGLARTGLVKLDAATGATVAAFKGTTGGGWVTDLDIANGKVYLTGTFTKVRSVARTRLGAVDVMTGALDAELNLALSGQNPSTAAQQFQAEHRLDVSADGTRMVIVGNFSSVGGVPRTQIAQIDLTTSPDSVVDWFTPKYPFHTSLKSNVNDIEIDPTGTYAVAVAGFRPVWSGLTPTALGDHAARWELASRGQIEPTWWTSSPTDTFTSVAISGSTVYVGGHFKWLNGRTSSDHTGAVVRQGLAALDPRNGVPMNWNPGRDRGWGVIDMLVTDNQLVIVHDTTTVGGEYHARLASFPLAGGSTPPAVALPALPTTLWSLPVIGTDITTSTFDGASVGAPTIAGSGDWSWVRGAFTNGTDLYAGSVDGKMYRLTWDGTTWGAPVDLTTRPDYVASRSLDLSTVTAMAFDGTGIFFTKSGDQALYWAGFNLESGLVGGYHRVAQSTLWQGAESLVIIGSTLYATFGPGAADSGSLIATPINGITPDIAGRVTVSGPALDGRNWSGAEVVAFAAA